MQSSLAQNPNVIIRKIAFAIRVAGKFSNSFQFSSCHSSASLTFLFEFSSNECIENPIYTTARNRYECYCRHKINQVNRPTVAHAANYSGRCHCQQSSYPKRTHSISIDSMNYLFSDNSSRNGRRNADIVTTTKQRTNNALYRSTAHIDFNEINDFRKRYADECISSLNRPVQLSENVNSLPSTPSSWSSMESMRRSNVDDDHYHIDWSDMRRLFHRDASGQLTQERKRSPDQIELINALPSAAVSFDRPKNSFALRHQPTKE